MQCLLGSVAHSYPPSFLVPPADGLLQVGNPPLQENGLPAHFTLGASASLAKKEAARRSSTFARRVTGELPSPDRMHVTLFFRQL